MTGATFHVTGRLVNGQRFKRITTDNMLHAFGINLFNGSVWHVDWTGKRTLIKNVRN